VLKTLTVVVAVLYSVASTDFANAQEAVYDFQTGNIVFNNISGDLALTILAPEADFLKGNATNLGGAAFSTNTAMNGSISWTNFIGINGTGLDAGNIIVPMTDPSLLSFLRLVSLSNSVSGTIQTINMIPEPTTLALAGLGLCGLLATRRRRS